MLRAAVLIATLLTAPSVAAYAQATANEDQAPWRIVNKVYTTEPR